MQRRKIVARLVCTGLIITAACILGSTVRVGGTPSPQSGPVPLDTTSQTYVLFLDMQEVESLHNVEMVVNQAEKHPANPVLPTGDLNDFDFHQASSWGGSVIFDEDEKVFKLWYVGARGGLYEQRVGYAWSTDGIVWHKPQLGLYEFRGSKENSITYQAPVGNFLYGALHPGLTDHFAVFKDYREPNPEKRYKGYNNIYAKSPTHNDATHFPVYSSDGIHWKVSSTAVASYPPNDIGNIFIDYDDPNPDRRIKIYEHNEAAYGPDLEHCHPDSNNPVIGGANFAGAKKDGLEDTVHLATAIHYRGYYIMLYDYDFWLPYYDYKGKADIRKRDSRVPQPKTGIFTGDARLAMNRDGIGKFTRVNPDQPLIARGKRSDWDGGFIVAAPPVLHDDKFYIFYTGVEEVGGISNPQWGETDDPSAIRTGLATLRLDGFTNLQTKDGLSRGTATTKAIEVKQADSARLVLNAGNLMPYRDWVEVELLDANTNLPIPGYEAKDCTSIFQEGVRIPVQWGQHKTLGGVQASAIKVRFYLYGQVKLYSFHFESPQP